MSELKEERRLRRDCEKAFHDADEGGKGYLTPEDYKVAVISLLGYKPSKYEVATVWRLHCPLHGNGTEPVLVKGAFVDSMVQRLLQEDTDELIRRIFLTFDVHCQGFITLQNCKAAFRQIAPHIAESEVETFFTEVDSNCDGRVSYRDFELLMKHLQLISIQNKQS